MRTQLAATTIALALAIAALSACGSASDVPAGTANGADSSDAAAAEAQPEADNGPLPLEGTQWLLDQLGDEPVVPEGPQGEPGLLLDASGLRASGTGGCNQFTGTYTVDAETGALSFSPLAATRRMCPEGMDVEAAFLDALGQVRSYALTEGGLELYDADGGLVARFDPGTGSP